MSGVTGGAHRVAFRASDGVATDLMDYWPSGHISCRNIRRPGWCYISEFWTTAQGSISYKGSGELLALKLDGSKTVEPSGTPRTRPRPTP